MARTNDTITQHKNAGSETGKEPVKLRIPIGTTRASTPAKHEVPVAEFTPAWGVEAEKQAKEAKRQARRGATPAKELLARKTRLTRTQKEATVEEQRVVDAEQYLKSATEKSKQVRQRYENLRKAQEELTAMKPTPAEGRDTQKFDSAGPGIETILSRLESLPESQQVQAAKELMPWVHRRSGQPTAKKTADQIKSEIDNLLTHHDPNADFSADELAILQKATADWSARNPKKPIRCAHGKSAKSHVIAQQILNPDRTPAANVAVVAYDKDWKKIAHTYTDKSGCYTLVVPRVGSYNVEVFGGRRKNTFVWKVECVDVLPPMTLANGAPGFPTRNETVEAIDRVNRNLGTIGASLGTISPIVGAADRINTSLGAVGTEVAGLAAETSDVNVGVTGLGVQVAGVGQTATGIAGSLASINTYPAPGTTAPGFDGAPDFNRAVDGAFRGILGVVPTAKNFVPSIEKASTIKQIEGRTEVEFHNRLLVGESTGTGTGAAIAPVQSRLAQKARDVERTALPILKQLTPLRANADPQDVEASRDVVFSTLQEFIRELCVDTGPRQLRVRDLSQRLNTALQRMRTAFGLQAHRARTQEEEINYANFLALQSDVRELTAAHGEYRSHRGNFFTSTLQDLTVRFRAIQQATVDTASAMDSVYLGESERQVLDVGPPGSGMNVSAIFDWITSFCTGEALTLAEEGIEGIRTLEATLQRLENLVSVIRNGAQNSPPDDRILQPRVQNALQQLRNHINEALNIVRRMPRR